MVTARRAGRWALYGIGAAFGCVVLFRVAIGVYLSTAAGKAMVAKQIAAQIGMPVKVTDVRIGLATSSIGMQVFDPRADASHSEVLAVGKAQADVSLFGLARGHVAPDWVTLDGVNLTIHVAADGKVITTLPQTGGGGAGGGESGGHIPRIKVTGGQLTIHQDGRPEFAFQNLSLTVTPEGSKTKLDGSIDDPAWAKWTITGEIDGTTKSGSVEIATTDGPLTMDRLTSVPFVPPLVWERVRTDGRGAIAIRVWTGSAGSVDYSVEVKPAAASLTLPDASLTLTKVTGTIRVSGAKITLAGTKGEVAGGTIAVDGDLDFGSEPSLVALKVSGEHLDIKRLPPEWALPKDFAGHLKGNADISLRIFPDGRIEPEGSGEGLITGVKVLGFDSDDIPIHLRKRGSRLEFHQPKKDSTRSMRERTASEIAAKIGEGGSPSPGSQSLADLSPQSRGEVKPGVGSGSLPSPLVGEGGEALRAGWGVKLQHLGEAYPPPATRRLAATSRTRGEVRTKTWHNVLSHCVAPRQEKKPADPPKADDDTPTLDASIRLRDIEISELLEKLNVKLGYRITGKMTVEATVAVPAARATSSAAYEFTGQLSSPALNFEGLTVRDISAKMVYKNGKLSLTNLSGKIDQPGKSQAMPGSFRGVADLAVSPPGDATASLTFDAISLEQLAKAVPDLKLDIHGTVSGKVNLKTLYEKLWDPAIWSGTGELTSESLTVEGRTAKDVRFSGEMVKGTVTIKEARMSLEGIPVSGEATLGVSGKYPFTATVRTTGTEITDLRKLVPEVEIPAPIEGVLETESKVTGTVSPLTFTASGTIKAKKLTLARSTANHIEAKWTLTEDKLTLSDLKADVFGGTVSGSADVPFDDKAGKFEVAFKELDAAGATELVPDFPVKITGKVSGKVSGTIPAAKPGESRVGNIEVDITAPRLTVQGIPADRLVGSAALKGKTLEYKLEGKTLGGSFELKGRYPGQKKKAPEAEMRGSFKLNGLDLSRIASDVGVRSLAPLRGRVDANFDFDNDLSAGAGRAIITGLRWGDASLGEELIAVLVLRDGVLELTEVAGRVAGGELRARARVLLNDTSRNFFSVSLSGVEAKRLLAPFGEVGGLLDGPMTLIVRGKLGREIRASGMLGLPRGSLSGIQVNDLRVPFEVSTAPGGYGRLSVHEASANAGSGRAQTDVTVEWGYATRVQGQIRFVDVPLRTVIPELGSSAFFGNGRLTGRFDLGGQNVQSIDDLSGTLIATLNNTTVKELPIIRQVTPFLGPSGLLKPFQAGDVRASLARGVFRVERLALANPTAQLFADGTLTTSGRVDLNVVAHTGAIGPDVPGLRLFGLRLPTIGPIPIGLIRDVSDFLSNRTIRLTITGTTSNPIVRVNVGALLRDEAIRFFLSRYVAPSQAAAVLGLSGSMDRK